MTSQRNQKILKLFDYFKRAFSLNYQHRQLYRPQILFLILRGVLIFTAGMSLIQVTRQVTPLLQSATAMKLLSIFWKSFSSGPLVLIIVAILVSWLGSIYVEAGLYSMYAQINSGSDDVTFTPGANRHFLPFVGGNLVIALFWILAALPYVIVGALTLTLGFTLIPIAVSALLMVWKAIIVTENVGTFEAITRSISFGRANFIPASVFIIIKNAVSRFSSGGGSGNYSNSGNFNFPGSEDGAGDLPISEMPFSDMPGSELPPAIGEGANDFVEFLQGDILPAIFAVVTGIIGISSVLVGMIHMLFDIFFGLTAVIIYMDRWEVPEPVVEEPQEESNERSVIS